MYIALVYFSQRGWTNLGFYGMLTRDVKLASLFALFWTFLCQFPIASATETCAAQANVPSTRFGRISQATSADTIFGQEILKFQKRTIIYFSVRF